LSKKTSVSRKPWERIYPKGNDQENRGFHKVNRKMVEDHLCRSVEEGEITEDEKLLINKYFKYIHNKNSGLSEVRMKKIIKKTRLFFEIFLLCSGLNQRL